MADIVLATLNARYAHASFGLRYLLANLGDLRERASLLEFEIKQPVDAVADQILAKHPRIVGLGVYIWNVEPMLALVRILRQRTPQIRIVLGGPEVSHEIERQEICALADHIITDEGDFAFPELCRSILDGASPAKIVRGGSVDVRRLALPYFLYDADDIAHRVIYVEASRGCPFTCEFCLSSLDVPLRRFPLETLLPAFENLLGRGVRVFKFVDRTFNLSIPYSLRLLEFFLDRYEPGLFLHFEMIPDRLPEDLRAILRAFPRGSLQFEVGIQTFNRAVAERIRRRQDYEKTVENLQFLLQETGSYIHADLIFGLPGESLESFAAGFDRLVAIGPQEIQVNRLKRLRGTPITRHDAEFDVKWNGRPPYDVVSNRDLDAAAMNRLARFAKFWDLYANSGHFIETLPQLWRSRSPFARFMEFADALHRRWGRSHGISLEERAEALFEHLGDANAASVLWRDLSRGAHRDMPKFLRPFLGYEDPRAARLQANGKLKRQARRFSDGAEAPTHPPEPASRSEPS